MTQLTHKKKIDSAVFAAAGGLLLWGGWASRKGAEANSATPLAVMAGYALGTYGAYRVSPKAGLVVGASLLAVGAINKHRRAAGKKDLPLLPSVELSYKSDSNDGLDAGLSKDTRAAVRAALTIETNAGVLGTFAQYLADAGHTISAHLVAQRAAQLASGTSVGLDVAVREAQQLLARLGYVVEPTGSLDARTRQALERFQSLHDLDITGEASPETLVALRRETHG